MVDKQIIIDGKDCRYWFRPNPDDYRKCSLRGKNDNCDEIKDCFVKELLGKLALKEQELQEAMDNYVQLDLQRVKEYNELVDLYKAKEQECETLQMSENEAGEIIAEVQAYKDVNEDFKTAWKELKAENEQAEQKLERVRQMLKNGVKIHDDIIVNKSILQIIDEVNDDTKIS